MRDKIGKKADLSMSTIVMAVIALLILIVLATMVVNNMRKTNVGILQCQNKGGVCSFELCSERLDGRTTTQQTWKCVDADNQDTGAYCCV
ncbi:MAG TPA: hypothetical protein VK158_01940 [Acidobacteriota bacterium]|nr:hypothetical protein [Acidobacteriota bacterium]